MNTSPTRRSRRMVAVVGALAVVASGLFGATAAQAAPGNIDSTTPGSVTIHKHLENNSAPASPDGSGSVSGDAVEDVEFTLYQVLYKGQPIDLSQFNDWNGLAAVELNADGTVKTPPSSSDFTRGAVVTTLTTDDTGAASHNVGTNRTAFIAVESDNSNAKVNGESVQIVSPAAPFVIAVPMPYEDEWIYAVHAYPKNSTAGITKDIVLQDENGLGLGSIIEFPVTTEIPLLSDDAQLTSYIVRDVLDSRLGDVDVTSVTVDGDEVYSSYYETKVNPNNLQDIRIVFTASGLDWLETQGGKQVVTVFSGTVKELGDGVIPNEAILYVNDPSGDTDTEEGENPPPGNPSNEVKSNWGDVLIQKSDAANDKALEGASFQVYEADPAYVTDGAVCTSIVTVGAPIEVNGQTTFTTTGSLGQITIDGLFVSDSENEPKNAAQRCYVLVETAAPAGYTLPTGDAAKTAITVKTGASTSVDVDVPNTKQDVPELPLTGAAGQLLMVAGGTALVAIAVGLVLMRRRATASL